MGIIKKRFDRNYFENILYREIPGSQRNRNRLKLIMDIKKNGKLLEIGCGSGGFLDLAAEYFDVDGIDISRYSVHHLKKRHGGKIILGNIVHTKLKKNYYDVIVIFNVLEHIKRPELAIRNIYNGLKQGGVLVGSVPNNSSLFGSFAAWFINSFIDKTHCSTFQPNYWLKAFKKYNFRKSTKSK